MGRLGVYPDRPFVLYRWYKMWYNDWTQERLCWSRILIHFYGFDDLTKTNVWNLAKKSTEYIYANESKDVFSTFLLFSFVRSSGNIMDWLSWCFWQFRQRTGKGGQATIPTIRKSWLSRIVTPISRIFRPFHPHLIPWHPIPKHAPSFLCNGMIGTPADVSERIRTYATACQRIQMHRDLCHRIPLHANASQSMPTYADACQRIRTHTSGCQRMRVHPIESECIRMHGR